MQTRIQRARKDENKINKIVDSVLRQIFGEQATSLIYEYLENNYSLKRNEVAEKIDLFAKGLEEFLKSGAYTVEKEILENLYSNYGLLRRLELERMQRQYDFVGQIKLLTRKM